MEKMLPISSVIFIVIEKPSLRFLILIISRRFKNFGIGRIPKSGAATNMKWTTGPRRMSWKTCMVRIEVDSRFFGPTITELEPVLSGISDDPVEVRWGGTKEEALLFAAHTKRAFVVLVASLGEMGTAAGLLGAALQVDAGMLNAGRDALASKKAYNWRKLAGELGPSAARSLLVKLAADAVREGKHPRLGGVATDILLGRQGHIDVDVVIRLRKAAGIR